MDYSADDLSCVDVQALQAASNWQAQFRLITQWGALISKKPALRTEHHRLRGCETAAWLAHQKVADAHYFYFDSDSKIICGLAAIVLSSACGKTSREIRVNTIEQHLQSVGINKHLTPSRNNGLHAVVARINQFIN